MVMATLQPTILPPATPSELLQHLIANTTYPATVIIGWPREDFINGLTEDINQQQPKTTDAEPPPSHPLLRATLFQTAISRHINIVFTPTVTHLRAYLATFAASKSRIPPPPNQALRKPPLLIVYGFLEIHRDGLEWSAQGLGLTGATFVQGALKDGFRAVIIEPRRTTEEEELDKLLKQTVPVVRGATMKDDGSWSCPVVSLHRVLGSWFSIDGKRDE